MLLDPDGNYQGPGRYRHYKGGEYEVLGLSVKEDTVEPPAPPPMFLVIYKPLTPGLLEEIPYLDFWARELSDFNMQVEVNEYIDEHGQKQTEEGGWLVPRFEKIDASV